MPSPQENLAQYISDEAKAKRQQVLDTSSWPRRFPRTIPRQENGCDCGVFTVKFGDYLVRSKEGRISFPVGRQEAWCLPLFDVAPCSPRRPQPALTSHLALSQARGRGLEFSQANMPYFRKRMVAEARTRS